MWNTDINTGIGGEIRAICEFVTHTETWGKIIIVFGED